MKCMRTITMVLAAALALPTAAGAVEQEGKKPVVTCTEIVEVYKQNQSVDQTSAVLKVDQKRVAECVKSAGLTPSENDR